MTCCAHWTLASIIAAMHPDLVRALGFIRRAELELSEAAIKIDEGRTEVARACLDEAVKMAHEAKIWLINVGR